MSKDARKMKTVDGGKLRTKFHCYVETNKTGLIDKRDSAQPRKRTVSQKQKGNSSESTQPKKRKLITASQKKAELEASNIAARQLFETSKVQSLEDEVSKLKQQLADARKTGTIGHVEVTPPDSPAEVIVSDENEFLTSDDSCDGIPTVSDYEKAVQKRREENRNLLKSLGIYKVC